MRPKKLLWFVFVVCFLAVLSSTPARADGTIDYVYSFDGNTFTWELPTNPVITSGNAYPGAAFTVGTINFTENGTSLTGIMDFFTSSSGGGFDLWDGSGFYWCNAGGAQMFSGPVTAPTLLSGPFNLIDYSNPNPNIDYPSNMNATAVPEPPAILLMLAGLALALVVGALRKA
jgi:hypothetical protein